MLGAGILMGEVGGGGGGGGWHFNFTFNSLKLCVMINFSLHYYVLCLSFIVVLYSTYSLYAVIKMILMKEVVMCNLKVHSRSIDHWSLLKHRNFDFALVFLGEGGGGGVTVIVNLNFSRVG